MPRLGMISSQAALAKCGLLPPQAAAAAQTPRSSEGKQGRRDVWPPRLAGMFLSAVCGKIVWQDVEATALSWLETGKEEAGPRHCCQGHEVLFGEARAGAEAA